MTGPAFHWVYPGIWDDPMGDDERILALYVLTNRSRLTEGFYRLTQGMARGELGWDADRYLIAWDALAQRDFAHHDAKAQVVFISKALKYHAPAGVKQITGAVRRIVSVTGAPDLFARFWLAAEKYAPDFSAALKAQYPGYVLPGNGVPPVTREGVSIGGV